MPVVWCIVVTLSVFGGITTRGVTGVRPTLARAVAEMLARDRERISRSTCFINAETRTNVFSQSKLWRAAITKCA